MNRNKWILITSSVLLVLLIFAGFMAIAAETTSETSPQVSASYITDVLAPETVEKVNAAIDEKTQKFENELNQKLAEYSEKLEGLISDFEERNEDIATNREFIKEVTDQVAERIAGAQTPVQSVTQSSGTSWQVVDIQKGQTIQLEIGGMILPRVGSAVCYATGTPGLIDVTDAEDLEAEKELKTNHLYVVTVAGRGFTATGDSNKFLISGEYSIK